MAIPAWQELFFDLHRAEQRGEKPQQVVVTRTQWDELAASWEAGRIPGPNEPPSPFRFVPGMLNSVPIVVWDGITADGV